MTAVYTRDASWHNRPDVRTPKKYHRESIAFDLMPACGNVSILDENSRREADQVSATALCRRCFPRGVGGRDHDADHDHNNGLGN